MGKRAFLRILKRALAPLPKDERDAFLVYYDEMIEDYREEGRSEQQAISTIGDPVRIAGEILAEHDGTQRHASSTGAKTLNIVLLILGSPVWGALLLALFAVILAAYVVIWCLPVVLGAGAITMVGVGLFSLLLSPQVIMQNLATGIALLGGIAAVIGCAGLLGLGTYYLSRQVVRATVAFTRWLRRCFRRKGAAA